jgi:hypothetical protein
MRINVFHDKLASSSAAVRDAAISAESGLMGIRPGDIHPLAPGRIVIEREDPLNGLGSARAGLEKRFERLAELAQARVRVFPGPGGRAVNAIERRGDLEDFGPRLEEVVVDDLPGFACADHDIDPWSSLSVRPHHGKTAADMQIVSHRARTFDSIIDSPDRFASGDPKLE